MQWIQLLWVSSILGEGRNVRIASSCTWHAVTCGGTVCAPYINGVH